MLDTFRVCISSCWLFLLSDVVFVGFSEAIIGREEVGLSFLVVVRGSCPDNWVGRVNLGSRYVSSVAREFLVLFRDLLFQSHLQGPLKMTSVVLFH